MYNSSLWTDPKEPKSQRSDFAVKLELQSNSVVATDLDAGRWSGSKGENEEEAVGKIGKEPVNSMEAGGKEDGSARSSVWIWVRSGSRCTWVACDTVESYHGFY
ncbi:hypothetical protein LXL04_000792 [Taraxacum kok-saghyz]